MVLRKDKDMSIKIKDYDEINNYKALDFDILSILKGDVILTNKGGQLYAVYYL